MTFKREGRSTVLSICIAVLAVILILGLYSSSEAATATAPGVISARAVDETSILLSVPYTGDDNGNNTYTVQYKTCAEGTYTAWITNSPHTISPYITTIMGLAANTCYDIKTTYNDPDGVSGSATQTLRITSTWDNTLLHNVNRFSGSAKWAAEGGWGLPATKYGNIVCETCHKRNAPNIKRISGNISAPETADQFPGQAGGLGINFQSTTDGFGDDTGGHSDSRKICEYCHSQTTYHRYNTAGQSNLTHNNNTDCLSCHPHAAGFYYATGACDSCHGNPPVVNTTGGPDGLASAPPTGSLTAGAHGAHTAKSVVCNNCHYMSSGTGATHRDSNVTLGFYAFDGGHQGGAYDGQATVNSYNASATTPATTVSKTGTKTCSNIYCHGSTMAPNGGTNTTPVWDNPLTAACGTCHGATATNPPTRGSHTRHAGSGSGGRALECTTCHLGYPTDHTGDHKIDGIVNWSIDTTKYSWLAGAQYRGSQTGTITTVPSTTYGSCSNIYCHSNVQTSPPGGPLTYATPLWGDASTGACGTCHGPDAGSKISTGSHAKHVSTYSLACSNCHSNAGYDTSKHADNNVDIEFSAGGSYSGTGTPGDAYGTCSTIYCHSNGRATPTYQTPTWGNAATGQCGTCHGVLAATPPASAPHTKHVGTVANYKYSCSKCHDSVADTTVDSTIQPTIKPTGLHADTIKEVQFDSYNSGGSYAGGSCSNIYCHSDGTTVALGGTPSSNVTWTSSVICSSCHQSPPSYANGSPKANSHQAHSCKTCNTCHYSTTTDGTSITNYSNHVNKAYELQAGNGVSFSYTYSATGGSCSNISCHGNSNAQWGDTLSVDSSDCIACHKTTNGSRRQIVDSNGDGSGIGGDFNKTSHHVLTQITNSVSGAVTTPSGPTATAAGTGGFTNAANAYLSDGSSATCIVNGNTQYYYNYGISLMGDTQTITKVEVGVTGSYSYATNRTSGVYIQVSWDGGTSWGVEQYVALPRATASTTYKTFTSSTTWDASKLSNSNFRVRVRNYFTSTPSTTNNLDWLPVRVTYDYSTTTSTPLSNAACVVCHDMTQHMCGNVRLKDADTVEIYTYDPAHPATAENFCLSCHDSNGANGNMSPFSDGATIGTIPYKASKDLKTNWQKTYGHKQQGLTCLGDGSPNTGCHSNGHGSDNVGLLSKNMTLPELEGYLYSSAEEYKYDLCFNCHQNYPRVTKEAILGYRLGGNYDIWGDGPPPYNIPNILTKFRDQNHDGTTGKSYDDPYYFTGLSNLHYFHLQSAWGWNYRGSVYSSINCLSCHNVHGSNTESGWVYDEMAYTHYTGAGSDQYGSMNIDMLNLDPTIEAYPVNCINSCHGILGKTYNWFEPSGE